MEENMNIVVELTYLIGAIAMGHSLYGIARLMRHMAKSEAINLIHLLFSLLGPFVSWQHIYQFVEQTGRGQCITSPFLLSLMAMLSLFLLIGISLTLYPTRLTSYTTENAVFINYLKESRRTFYFLITVYLVTITMNNFLLGLRPQLTITSARLLIFLVAAAGFLINIENSSIDNKRIDLNLRIPYFEREQNNLGIDLKKQVYLLHLFSFDKRGLNLNDWQEKVYGRLDGLIFITVLIGFVTIAIVRNI